MSCTVIYDGVNLGDYCKVVAYSFPALPEIEPRTVDILGVDGEPFLGARLKPLEITVKLSIAADSICPVDIREKWAEVAPLLRKEGPRPLSFGGEKYYMAYLAGTTEIDIHGYYGDVEATFRCPDPVAFGARRSVVVPSGGSVTFNVGGSYPTSPTVEALATRGSGGTWGVLTELGEFLRVQIPTSAATAVALDCKERTCRVAGATTLPTITSDWLVFEPGPHTLTNDQGSGDATVTWDERWL